jgi:type I restriction enzyme S subunit
MPRTPPLPQGWIEVALAEIVAETLGGDWGAEAGAEAPEGLVRVGVVRGLDFRDWDERGGAVVAARAVRPESLAKRRLAAGDLLLEVSGGGVSQPVGRTVLIEDEALRRSELPLICSNFCRRLRFVAGVVPGYVNTVLRHQYRQGAFDPFQTQTTNLRNLRFRDFLAGVRVPLPPRDVQERIAVRHGELSDVLARAEGRVARARQTLRRLRRALAAAACSGRLTAELREAEVLGEAGERQVLGSPPPWQRRPWRVPEPLAAPRLPRGWVLASLRDLLVRTQHGTSQRAERALAGGIPILRMGNVRDGAIDDTDLKYLGGPLSALAAFLLRPGDLLFNRTNSPNLVGKAAVFEGGRLAVFASYLVRLEVDSRLVDSRYLAAWINSPWGRRWARAVRTDGVSQSNINMARLLSLPVPVPPLAEQREIARRLKMALAGVERGEERLAAVTARAAEIRRAVMERALRGGL